MLKGKSWGRGSGRNAGTERGVHGGAARKEGERTCARWHSERGRTKGTGARRRGTRDGTQTKTVNWVVGSTTLREGKEGHKEGDSKIDMLAERVWGDGVCLQGRWRCVESGSRPRREGVSGVGAPMSSGCAQVTLSSISGPMVWEMEMLGKIDSDLVLLAPGTHQQAAVLPLNSLLCSLLCPPTQWKHTLTVEAQTQSVDSSSSRKLRRCPPSVSITEENESVDEEKKPTLYMSEAEISDKKFVESLMGDTKSMVFLVGDAQRIFSIPPAAAYCQLAE
ncbi:hypothetical protein BC826DRAFT_1154254, partial [Russula brevipes]